MTQDASGPTIFMFGYWGAGSSTRALVDGINAAEAHRGFAPPLWADVRISRSVRAAGFRDRAFGDLLGKQYVWIPDLGNVCVAEKREGMEIKNPAAANILLDHALSSPGRRVIFFCSCTIPAECHRYAVAKLVKKAASRRSVAVTVIEWPGGAPAADVLELQVPASVLRGIRSGKSSFKVPDSLPLAAAATLPWGTKALLRAGHDQIALLLGPAQFTLRGAIFQVLGEHRESKALRKAHGFDALK